MKNILLFALFFQLLVVGNHTFGQNKPQVWFPNLKACPDSSFKVPIRVSQFKSILAFQFEICWPAGLSKDSIADIHSELRKDLQFNEKDTTLTVIWTDEQLKQLSLDEGDTLFTLVFTKKTNTNVAGFLEFLNNDTPPIYAYAGTDEVKEDTMATLVGKIDISHPFRFLKTSDTSFCKGIVAEVGISPLTPGVSYLWSTGATNAKIMVNSAGIYKVSLTNNFGCQREDSIKVELFAVPQINLEDTLRFCAGTTPTITLKDTTGNRYVWSTGQQGSQIELRSIGRIWVRATNSAACSNTDTLIAINHTLPPVQIEITDEQCNNAEGNLLVRVANGQVLQYQLNNGRMDNSPRFNGLVAGTYRLKIQNLEACLLKDTQIIVQNRGALEFEELKVQPVTCAQKNGGIQIQVSGESGITRFSVDGQNYTAQSSFTGLSTGTYTVYAQDSFCTISLNTNVLADTARPFKISAIEPIPAECNAQNGQVKIIVSGLNTDLIYRINSNTYTAPIVSDLKVGSYMLTAENDQGCRDSMPFEITRTNCQVYIPNAFSPNADNINDKFILLASGGFIKSIKSYRIFDRWGNLIYRAPSTNIDFRSFNEWWDGLGPRGERLAQGPYIYSIEVELFPGFGKSFTVYKGEVNLLH